MKIDGNKGKIKLKWNNSNRLIRVVVVGEIDNFENHSQEVDKAVLLSLICMNNSNYCY